MTVEVDWTPLDRAMSQLSRGLDQSGDRAAQTQATSTAGRIRAGVPVRTGRLASTVRVVRDQGGWAVTYGGGLPYARKIERRSHAVEAGVRNAEQTYTAAQLRVAQTEAGRL